MPGYSSDFHKSEAFAEIERQLKTLWEEHRALEKTDPDKAIRVRQKIGLLHGQIATGRRPDDTHDWWCVWCERVSVQTVPLDSFSTCRYENCDPQARVFEMLKADPNFGKIGAGHSLVPGQYWSYVRENYHPEYPETAEVGKRYPVPEIPIRLESDPLPPDQKEV
ncbi:MAG: hypothetical protein H7308_13235 [Chthonomonadaceae bacterium]|nr:hypothetical protein [Chthonomonadaceae bacterium]